MCVCVYIYIYIYIYIIYNLYICNTIHCTEEINTALQSDYTPIKNKFYQGELLSLLPLGVRETEWVGRVRN